MCFYYILLNCVYTEILLECMIVILLLIKETSLSFWHMASATSLCLGGAMFLYLANEQVE